MFEEAFFALPGSFLLGQSNNPHKSLFTDIPNAVHFFRYTPLFSEHSQHVLFTWLVLLFIQHTPFSRPLILVLL